MKFWYAIWYESTAVESLTLATSILSLLMIATDAVVPEVLSVPSIPSNDSYGCSSSWGTQCTIPYSVYHLSLLMIATDAVVPEVHSVPYSVYHLSLLMIATDAVVPEVLSVPYSVYHLSLLMIATDAVVPEVLSVPSIPSNDSYRCSSSWGTQCTISVEQYW